MIADIPSACLHIHVHYSTMTRLFTVVKIAVLIGILVTAIFNTTTLVYFLYTDTHSIAVDHPTSSINNIRIESPLVQSYIHGRPQSREDAYKTEPEDSRGKQGMVNAMAASIGGVLPNDPSSSRQTESAPVTGTHLPRPPENPPESQHHEIHLQSQSFSVPSHPALSSTSLPPTTPSPQHPTPATSRPTLQKVVSEAGDHSVVTQARKRGYVIGVSFWDQQTFSTGSIANLQCWAGSMEMLVAEPFMVASKFSAPIKQQNFLSTETQMSLSDMYNIEVWNERTKRGAPLVRWADFLREAPRSVILVELKSIYRYECSVEVMKRDYTKFLIENGFTVIREVCFNKTTLSHKLSMKQFSVEIFASLLPDSVTVILEEWSSNTVGVIIELDECTLGLPLSNLIAPSERALNDTERYIQTYMNGSRRYVALMVRSEWAILNAGSRQAEQIVSECFVKTLSYWNQTVQATGLNHTFVTLDIGKYGSKTDPRLISSPLINMATDLLRTVHHNSSLSFSDWEHTFEEASNSTNCGYIGFLQKLVATRAKCLLLVGGGSYQKHALSMYRTLHARKDHCFITTNTKCDVKLEGVNI